MSSATYACSDSVMLPSSPANMAGSMAKSPPSSADPSLMENMEGGSLDVDLTSSTPPPPWEVSSSVE
eukprot:scaffold220420_cov39-Attheya_sp.AAC.2